MSKSNTYRYLRALRRKQEGRVRVAVNDGLTRRAIEDGFFGLLLLVLALGGLRKLVALGGLGDLLLHLVEGERWHF